jgi:hypothetical protein
MAGIHVRNLVAPSVTSLRGVTLFSVVAAELLRVARWTFSSDEGGGRWQSNVTLDEPGGFATGFRVNPASPRVIYDPLGRFTTAMVTNGAMISLFAANDQNCGMYRIAERIDANNIRISTIAALPAGWLLETGIPGRVIDLDTWLIASDYTIMNAPSPSNMQARIFVVATSGNVNLYVRPRGKIAVPAESALYAAINAYYLFTLHFNMYADGQNVVIYAFANSNGSPITYIFGWGELDEAPLADVRPGFVFGNGNLHADYGNNLTVRMLDHADGPINGLLTWLRRTWDDRNSAQTYRQSHFRLLGGKKAPVRRPEVFMDNVATGAYLRGRFPPILGQTYQLYDRERPFDSAGNWLHLDSGIIVPRAGADDPLPLRAL